MNNINEEYKRVLINLINASSDNKIKWVRQNPTTIYQEMTTGSGSRALMSIQQVRPNGGHYIFTVKNISKNEIVITIDSSRNREFSLILDDLYKIANYNLEKRSLDFLDDIIEGLK